MLRPALGDCEVYCTANIPSKHLTYRKKTRPMTNCTPPLRHMTKRTPPSSSRRSCTRKVSTASGTLGLYLLADKAPAGARCFFTPQYPTPRGGKLQTDSPDHIEIPYLKNRGTCGLIIQGVCVVTSCYTGLATRRNKFSTPQWGAGGRGGQRPYLSPSPSLS